MWHMYVIPQRTNNPSAAQPWLVARAPLHNSHNDRQNSLISRTTARRCSLQPSQIARYTTRKTSFGAATFKHTSQPPNAHLQHTHDSIRGILPIYAIAQMARGQWKIAPNKSHGPYLSYTSILPDIFQYYSSIMMGLNFQEKKTNTHSFADSKIYVTQFDTVHTVTHFQSRGELSTISRPHLHGYPSLFRLWAQHFTFYTFLENYPSSFWRAHTNNHNPPSTILFRPGGLLRQQKDADLAEKPTSGV